MKIHVLSLTIYALVGFAFSIVQAAPPDTKPSPSTPVEVMNTASNPVPISIVQPVIEPEQQINVCGASQGGNPIKLLYSVPAGKRLAIDFVSLKAPRTLDDGESLHVFIKTSVQGVTGEYLLGSVRDAGGFADSRLVKVFADPGTDVTLNQASVSSNPFLSTGAVCVSGRLLPIGS